LKPHVHGIVKVLFALAIKVADIWRQTANYKKIASTRGKTFGKNILRAQTFFKTPNGKENVASMGRMPNG
jgi:hypothetical protein